MKREIKFRAWTGKKMVFADLSLFIWSMGHQCAEDVSLEEEVGEEVAAFQNQETEKTIMQFTGLKDKNGKEIYEGDLVKAHGNGSPVIFENGSFEWNGEPLNYEDGQLVPTTEWAEVIGNIHQNPELT